MKIPCDLWASGWLTPYVGAGNTPECIRSAVTSSWRRKNRRTKRIAIPAHDPLRLGTLVSILRAVAQHKRVTRDAIIESL